MIKTSGIKEKIIALIRNSCINIYWLYGFIGLIILLNYIFINPLRYALSDAYYYAAIADSIYGGHGFFDFTTIPKQPIITLQNGIVGIHLILMKFGILDPDYRLVAVLIFNFFLFLGDAYLIHKIFSCYNIEKHITSIVIGVFLLLNPILKTILQATNDGTFLFLELCLITCIIKNHEKFSYLRFFLIMIDSILICQFRNQGFLILLCAAFSYLIIRDFKKSAIHFLFFVLSITSLTITIIYVDDLTGIKGISQWAYNGFSLLGSIKALICEDLPALFLGSKLKYINFSIAGGMIALTLIAIIYNNLKRSYLERNFTKLFLVLVLSAEVCFYVIFPYSFRYLLVIFPIFVIFINQYFNDNKILRNALKCYLIYVILLLSFHVLYWDSFYSHNMYSTRSTISEIEMTNMILISQDERQTYFYLRKSAWKEPIIPIESREVLIYGQHFFINQHLEKISEQRGIESILWYSQTWIFDKFGEPFKLVLIKLK